MADYKEFDFKSVGVKTNAPKQPSSIESIPIGIKTPMKLGQGSDGIFQMNFDLVEQIKDNLKNLLLTNHGERVILYDFGANLQPLTLELGSELFDEEVLVRINTAVNKFMPFVSLDRMEREINHLDNEHLAKIRLRIYYNVPSLRAFNQLVEVSFFVGG